VDDLKYSQRKLETIVAAYCQGICKQPFFLLPKFSFSYHFFIEFGVIPSRIADEQTQDFTPKAQEIWRKLADGLKFVRECA
jgi:hypothetical protein